MRIFNHAVGTFNAYSEHLGGLLLRCQTKKAEGVTARKDFWKVHIHVKVFVTYTA
jgi:hypothetical protein